FDFLDGEYILAISGSYQSYIGELKIITYIPSKKQARIHKTKGDSYANQFDSLPLFGTALTCLYGSGNSYVTSIGMYEGEVQGQQLQQFQQLQQLSDILFPNKPYNFHTLKQEIKRFKYQELAPQIRNEKIKFEELTLNIKTKAGHLEKIVDLLLETQKQAIKSNDQFIQGQIVAYQNILEGNLTKNELQILLAKQKEIHQLEECLTNLQINK
ncbi:704_t:CDS:1, partial [Dentiscutata heterogama]